MNEQKKIIDSIFFAIFFAATINANNSNRADHYKFKNKNKERKSHLCLLFILVKLNHWNDFCKLSTSCQCCGRIFYNLKINHINLFMEKQSFLCKPKPIVYLILYLFG